MNVNSLNKLAWKRFKNNNLSFLSFCFVVFFFLISVFGVLLAPDKSPLANDMHLELSIKKPFEKIEFLAIPSSTGQKKIKFKNLFIGFPSYFEYIPISSYNITEAGVSYVVYGSEDRTQFKGDYKIIQRYYMLGTDKYGRDLLSRIIHAIRISFSVGFIAVIISLIIGISLGLIAGYFRGSVDNLIMWLINVIWSIPTLLMVIAISLALGKGFWQLFVAIGLTMWVEVARVVRGQVLFTRELEYVQAGKVLAYGSFRIIFRHILPNVFAPIIIISVANFSAAILIESGLSFLGIGVQPPLASLGTIIKNHYSYIILNDAYLAVFPGLVIMFMVMSFMLLGNGMRDAFDVKN